MNDMFLPIGTIVSLKDAKEKIMITGYLPVLEEEKVIFDYCGCFFPEGYLSANSNSLFNKTDIAKVEFLGPMDDPSYKEFVSKLDTLAKEIDKEINNSSNKQ